MRPDSDDMPALASTAPETQSVAPNGDAPSSPLSAPDPASLIDRHQADVWRFLRALGCDPALADDLTQDTFVQLLTAPFEFRGHAATASWLRATATSLLRKLLRRQRLVDIATIDEINAAEVAWERWHARGDARADARTVQAALAECLQLLTERARQAVQLHYAESRSGEETADALGISHANARVILHRARQTLRDCVNRKVAADD